MRRHELVERRNSKYKNYEIREHKGGFMVYDDRGVFIDGAFETLEKARAFVDKAYQSEKKNGYYGVGDEILEKRNKKFKITMEDGEAYTLEAPNEEAAAKKHSQTVGGKGSKIKTIEEQNGN